MCLVSSAGGATVRDHPGVQLLEVLRLQAVEPVRADSGDQVTPNGDPVPVERVRPDHRRRDVATHMPAMIMAIFARPVTRGSLRSRRTVVTQSGMNAAMSRSTPGGSRLARMMSRTQDASSVTAAMPRPMSQSPEPSSSTEPAEASYTLGATYPMMA